MVKKLIEFIKWPSGRPTFEKIFREYPILKPLEDKKDVAQVYSNFEAIKWQRIYTLFSIILTLALIVVTLSYTIQTSKLNDITSNQFEAENRPYITLENLSFYRPNLGLPGYQIELKNSGNSPTKILKIEMMQSPSNENADKWEETEEWIFPEETLLIDWGKFLNMAGGFKYLENTTSFARIIVYYQWGEEEYKTTRDFYTSYLNEIVPDWGESITLDKGGQIIDENAPSGRTMLGIHTIVR